MLDRSTSTTYICEECIVAFTVFARKLHRRPRCPRCGEVYSLVPYSKHKSAKGQGVAWTDAEREIIMSKAKEGMLTYQIAYVLGRTPKAVSEEMRRMRSGKRGKNFTKLPSVFS